MNSNRSSKAVVVGLVGLALLVAAVAPAAAVPTIDGSVQSERKVGNTVDQTFTFTNLFDEYTEWTLTGETDLTKVTWTVTTYDNTGQQIAQETYTGQSFEHHLTASSGAVKATVRLQATVPQVPESLWSYDPPQQYVVGQFSQAQQGGSSTTIEKYTTRPFTEQSSQARAEINDAKAAIQEAQGAGVSVPEAQKSLDNAISAYNNENFGLAIELANEAEERAEAAMESSQTTQLIIYAVVGVVVLALVAGGVLYYLRNRETQDKLA